MCNKARLTSHCHTFGFNVKGGVKTLNTLSISVARTGSALPSSDRRSKRSIHFLCGGSLGRSNAGVRLINCHCSADKCFGFTSAACDQVGNCGVRARSKIVRIGPGFASCCGLTCGGHKGLRLAIARRLKHASALCLDNDRRAC